MNEYSWNFNFAEGEIIKEKFGNMYKYLSKLCNDFGDVEKILVSAKVAGIFSIIADWNEVQEDSGNYLGTINLPDSVCLHRFDSMDENVILLIRNSGITVVRLESMPY